MFADARKLVGKDADCAEDCMQRERLKEDEDEGEGRRECRGRSDGENNVG